MWWNHLPWKVPSSLERYQHYYRLLSVQYGSLFRNFSLPLYQKIFDTDSHMGICIVTQSDQQMHAKILLLQTWMQMMTVSASWTAWQSITLLILYATVSWTLILEEVSSDKDTVGGTSHSTAVSLWASTTMPIVVAGCLVPHEVDSHYIFCWI